MKTTRPAAPRLALTKAEAAGSLGISLDTFNASVLPELRVKYLGRRVLVPVAELERWLRESSTRSIAEALS